ncbi:uncharacterized protein [Dysidea avara]|uniref:uncharacterized protein isoform X2 n=1 Tax=Dysidea avara TaxID=196820 RepID=UPI00331A65E0
MATRKMALDDFEEFVRHKVEVEKMTHPKLRDLFQEQFPGEKGFSLRSIEKFCSERGIKKTTKIDDDDLDEIVSRAVSCVGPTYGRKMMTGLLSSHGVQVSQNRVGDSLGRVNPGYQSARNTATSHQTNPVPYHADYFGHKLHVDQNEKLVMYGVTHVTAVDGYSGMIVGFTSMPIKNNIEIYCNLYKPIVLEYGLWDQRRIDQGKEWVLMLHVQETLAHLRHNTCRPPHLQSTSKQNHIVERMWVEINTRVNYPIKSCLVSLETAGDIDMDCPHTKYCVSWFTLQVVNVGTTIVVQSWNSHPISGRRSRVPFRAMIERNCAVQIDPTLLPDGDSAVNNFESYGGQLTIFSPFGEDPLRDHPALVTQREAEFHRHHPIFSDFFHTVVNGDFSLFREGILSFIDISKNLSMQV